MRVVAYYRVSTARQGQSGLGLEAQRAAVTSYVAGRGELIAELTEVESGRRNERPQLAAALNLCRRKRAVLVIAKLDRLARNVAFIASLMEAGVEFIAADMPEANRLTLHVMAAFAEHEREAISRRTREALRVAKEERGVKLGNPRPDLARMTAAAADRAAAIRAGAEPLARKLRAEGLSLRAVAAELNARHQPTPNGQSWHAGSVGRLLSRCSARDTHIS